MLKRSPEDDKKRDAIPERHCLAEYASQRGGRLGVGALPKLVQLRVDEGGHGKLITGHQAHDGCSGYVVSGCHSGIGCRAIARRIVK